jgi:opacity protein-like surface antigen
LVIVAAAMTNKSHAAGGKSMKMNRVRYLILAAVLLMSAASFASVSAQPPSTHALLHLSNKSNAIATVYYKWGNGKWKRAVIGIGQSYYFNYKYDGQSRHSPDFFVRLDVDTNGVRFVEHVLSRGQSPDDNSIQYGHHFVIKQLTGTDTRYIQAVTTGARVRVTDINSSRPDVQ